MYQFYIQKVIPNITKAVAIPTCARCFIGDVITVFEDHTSDEHNHVLGHVHYSS